MSPKKGTGLSAWSDADRKARREKEAHQAKLAELGARVLAILELSELPAAFDFPDKIGAVRGAAMSLGLIALETPEEERSTPLDDERESLSRQNIERFERGEVQ